MADTTKQESSRRAFLTGIARTGLTTGLAALAYALLRRRAPADARNRFDRCRTCRLYAKCTIPAARVSTCNEQTVTD